MNPIEALKLQQLVPPQLKDNGAFTGNTYVDTSGWNKLRIAFIVGTLDIAVGSTTAGTAPYVEECDTTGGSYTAVTDAALSAVIGAGDDDKNFAIDIDLTKTHKRYMQVNAPTAGDGTNGANMTIIALLSRPASSPVTAAEQGFEEIINA
jgi:hypothetical protein